MKTWKINLRNTKNNMLVGDVGEAIALHYLTNQGFFLVARAIRFRAHGEIILTSAHYQKQRETYTYFLTDKQKGYLNNFPTWDYVALKKECESYLVVHEGKTYFRDWRNPYLVEVKTVRGKGRPHKKPNSNTISKAKALGFKPVLVIVRLLENWDTVVQASEL